MERTKLHQLGDTLAIAICAVICGAEGWTDIELFGKSKESWFKTFLELPNGIPSHDTFGRVISALAPDAFERCFQSWIQSLAGSSGGNRLFLPSIYHAVGLNAANPGVWGRTPDSFTGFCMLHLKAREI